jgi:hypothetical protein
MGMVGETERTREASGVGGARVGGGRRTRLGNLGALAHRLGVSIGLRCGGSFFHPSDDRTMLENQILPWYQISAAHQEILFVGTEWFTHGYVRMFSHKSLSTLDIDPAKARFGADRHMVGSVSELDRHVAEGRLDLVLINGVLGWGLDTLDEAERAIAGCDRCLRPGGHLVIGWNDLAAHRLFRLDEISSLGRFQPFVFPPLGASEVRVANEWRHVFSFYERRGE